MTIEAEATDVAGTETSEESTSQPTEKTYTQKQLDAIMKRKESKWAKAQEELEGKLVEVSTLLEETSAKANKGMSAEEKLKKLEADFKRQLAKANEEKEAVLRKHKESKISAELMKVASKATRPEIVAKLLREKVRIDEDDKVFAVDEYDTPQSLDEAAESFFRAYPEFVPPPKGGSGTRESQKADIQQPQKGFANRQDYDAYVASLIRQKG